jgi:hypothetical protein
VRVARHVTPVHRACIASQTVDCAAPCETIQVPTNEGAPAREFRFARKSDTEPLEGLILVRCGMNSVILTTKQHGSHCATQIGLNDFPSERGGQRLYILGRTVVTPIYVLLVFACPQEVFI